MVRVIGELDCFSAHICLRESDKSKDKAESTDREGRDADVRQRIVGPWAWQCHGMVRVTGELDRFSAHIRLREPSKSEDRAEGGTFVESSIPCSHGERALVVKGAEEVVERDEKAMTSPEGLSYPKSKVSVRKEVDSEERHIIVEADLLIAKEEMQMQGNG
ncbi:hypothetical protein B296_00017014 [Ensete ventricosum]|uniref:Uncharacterized protein n=1 Tax=Ensete ventricosum TaxID=4639 RepID=A0A426YT24_ENSVE|nr:hypothetical protein B296_00017014 [Ensete ventricosum]